MTLTADKDTNLPARQTGPIPTFIVSSFAGNGCSGNRHVVLMPDSPLNSAQARSLSQQWAPDIVVVLNSIHRDIRVKAEFYHYGRCVRWCGSGILAAAELLANLSSTAHAIQTACSYFPILRHQELQGFSTDTRLSWRPVRHQALWRRLFGMNLVEALESPNPTGYTLIELDNELAVSRWRPRLRHLQRYSQRALIVTAKARAGHQDYVMRYFAPQYGNNEDSATGSANALLISYWASRLNRSWLRGRQLSASGGQFYGRSLGRTKTLLFGEARIESRQALFI